MIAAAKLLGNGYDSKIISDHIASPTHLTALHREPDFLDGPYDRPRLSVEGYRYQPVNWAACRVAWARCLGFHGQRDGEP